MKPLHINFLTTHNKHNGYGMTREYFKKYLPSQGIILDDNKSDNDISLTLHIPPAIEQAKGKIKILYTMIEGDEVPDEWKKYLDMADYILVPTQFVADTFKRDGFNAEVIPLGYDANIFKPAIRVNNDVYTFLHYEAFQDRKGWEELLDAWTLSGMAEKEFETKLILKTIVPFNEVYKMLEDKNIALPYNVQVVSGSLPHECLNSLLAEADCFVFPSRGEGFSLPPLEAMATGCPVILSKGHSHMDYFDERYMYGVEATKKVPARYSNWGDQGNFVRCNIDSLSKTIEHVYNNQEQARQKGLDCLEYIGKYRYDKVIKKLSNFIWQIQDTQVQRI